jgi:hypothetical protein
MLDDGTISIPKRDLIGALAVGFESKRLRIAAGLHHADTLEREAAAFTMKLSASGHDTYNAREGEHDDLLLAVALPVWHALKADPWAGVNTLVTAGARDSRLAIGRPRQPDHLIRRNGGEWTPARTIRVIR